jgi:hypothetical protein
VRPDDETSLVLNPKFKGASYFSWTTLTDAKREQNTKMKKFWKTLDLILTAVLLALSVGCYIVSRKFIDNATIQGIAINISTGVINYAYIQLAEFFVEKENFKYFQEYKNSLLYRLAIFKFVNIHLPIIYALVDFKT